MRQKCLLTTSKTNGSPTSPRTVSVKKAWATTASAPANTSSTGRYSRLSRNTAAKQPNARLLSARGP